MNEETQTLEEALRTCVLERDMANRALESIRYAMSHDLRAPLRNMSGFSKEVMDTYKDGLGEEGIDWLHRVRKASQRMEGMIDDLIEMLRVAQVPCLQRDVNLTAMAASIAVRLRKQSPLRQVEFVVMEGVHARGDAQLLWVALSNLLDNAWKFSSVRPCAIIEFGKVLQGEKSVCFVRDNGAGFDMDYVEKLFSPFQRLHKASEFSGEGIGLALVRQVVERHGGTVWAEGKQNQGATVYFTLPSASMWHKASSAEG